jgi:hypothetical protein
MFAVEVLTVQPEVQAVPEVMELLEQIQITPLNHCIQVHVPFSQKIKTNLNLAVHTVNIQKPDGLVFDCSFSGYILCPVLKVLNHLISGPVFKWSASLDLFI